MARAQLLAQEKMLLQVSLHRMGTIVKCAQALVQVNIMNKFHHFKVRRFCSEIFEISDSILTVDFSEKTDFCALQKNVTP